MKNETNFTLTAADHSIIDWITDLHKIDMKSSKNGLGYYDCKIDKKNLSKLLHFIDTYKYHIPRIRQDLQNLGNKKFGW